MTNSRASMQPLRDFAGPGEHANVSVLFVHRWGAIMAGGEQWISSMAKHLPGKHVRVCAAVGYEGPLMASLESMGVDAELASLAELRTGTFREVLRSTIFTALSTLTLVRIARRKRVNLIHVFSLECIVSAYLASRIRRIPVVATVMNCGPFPALDIRVLSRCDAVVSASDAVKRDLVAAGVPDEKIQTIYTGADSVHVSSHDDARCRLIEMLDLPKDAVVVGMVATLERKKAQDVLIKAFPAVISAVPRAYLVLFGKDHQSSPSTPGPYEAELRSLTQELGVQSRVRFAGFHAEAANLVAGFDVAVLCSRKEALGIAAIEALANRMPLVATDVEGIPEVVVDGVTGLLVPPDDPDALAGHIVQVLIDRELAMRLADNGQAFVRRTFELASLVSQNVSVYARVGAKTLQFA